MKNAPVFMGAKLSVNFRRRKRLEGPALTPYGMPLTPESLEPEVPVARPLALSLLLLWSAPLLAAAPFQSARTIDDAPFKTQGDVTIVHYWATWCAPCRLEMPVLDAFYRKHRGQGLAMLAVSIDQGVSTRKLKQVTGQFAFPVARVDDVRMPRRDIPTALPVTRVYDRTGRLRFQTRGDGRTTIDSATLERVVSPLLAER
jgi:thiol-disulfide isomerase/thioredoxin